MRKKKRNALKDVATLKQQGRTRDLIGYCAPVELKALRFTTLNEAVEAVRGKQRSKGSSRPPMGWGSTNPHFN